MTFTPTYYVHQFGGLENDTDSRNNLSSYTTRFTYNSVTARNAFGTEKWKVHVGGYFYYDFVQAEPVVSEHYSRVGEITTWSRVNSSHDASTYTNGNARMMQSGDFEWRVSGIVLERGGATVIIRCDKYGNLVEEPPNVY